LDKARRGGAAADVGAILAGQIEVAGVPVVAARVDVDARATLATLVDQLRDKLPRSVVVLGAELDGKAALIAAVGPELRGDRRFHAGRLIGEIAERVEGRGGGRPDFAQAGGAAPDRLDAALGEVAAIVERMAGS